MISEFLFQQLNKWVIRSTNETLRRHGADAWSLGRARGGSARPAPRDVRLIARPPPPRGAVPSRRPAARRREPHACAPWVYPPPACVLVRRAGLLYSDLLFTTPTVYAALERLPFETRQRRDRRIDRAVDISQKHAELPHAAAPDPYGPDAFYLEEAMAEVEAEDNERTVLKFTDPRY